MVVNILVSFQLWKGLYLIINLGIINLRMATRRMEYSDSDDDEVIEATSLKEKPTIKLKEWLHNFKPNSSQSLKSHILSFMLS